MKTIFVAVVLFAIPAAATTSDGSCPAPSEEPIAAVASSVRSARGVSDRKFRKDVSEFLTTTDGVWGPSVDKMKSIKKSDLNACLTNVYKGMESTFDGVSVYTAKVDGRSIYLFDGDGDGFQQYDLRDAKCRSLKMGDKPHEKIPLPHSEEPDHPIGKKQWLKDLKDAMRYPVQAHDTPIVTGAAVPEAIRDIVKKMKAEKDSDGLKEYESVEVHHVRVDGHDSWLIYGNAYEGVSEEMFDIDGKKLDVMF